MAPCSRLRAAVHCTRSGSVVYCLSVARPPLTASLRIAETLAACSACSWSVSRCFYLRYVFFNFRSPDVVAVRRSTCRFAQSGLGGSLPACRPRLASAIDSAPASCPALVPLSPPAFAPLVAQPCRCLRIRDFSSSLLFLYLRYVFFNFRSPDVVAVRRQGTCRFAQSGLGGSLPACRPAAGLGDRFRRHLARAGPSISPAFAPLVAPAPPLPPEFATSVPACCSFIFAMSFSTSGPPM